MAKRRAGRLRRDSHVPRLVIMAKRPAAGSVKRRLAHDIGDVAAVRFYRSTLANTVMRLAADPRWRTYLSVAPDTAIAESCWPLAPHVQRIPQGTGDLGQRMQAAVDRLPPGPVIIVGSDIPAIRPSYIARAFKALGHADAVFGPAPDGGYWLVGLKRTPRRLSPFADVPWSTQRALAATIENLQGRRIAYAATLSDVDTRDDYVRECQTAQRLVAKPCDEI